MTAGRLNSKGNNVNWNTPKNIADKVHDFFDGGIHLDPCSNSYSVVRAKRSVVLPECGLSLDWSQYANIFINPPYGRGIKPWFKKARDHQKAHAGNIILLVPVGTNTSHWKEYVFNQQDTSVCFIRDSRLKFGISGCENNKGAPMACALLYFGRDVDKFKRMFSSIGNFL